MEKTPLHAQKVTILSRLIKESSLTLEEALLLLKEEEEVEEASVSPTFPGTTSPYVQPYTPWPYGTSSNGNLIFRTTGNVGIGSTSPASTFTLTPDSSSTTTSLLNITNTANMIADLNS